MRKCPTCGCDREHHRQLERFYEQENAARQERALATARRADAQSRYYRSDAPITTERWVTAREIRGLTIEQFAVTLNIPVEQATAIEQGREQPSEQLQRIAARFGGFHPKWFRMPPPPDFPMPSDCEWYVCDVCERAEPGGKIAPEDEHAFRADHRCVTCGEDICEEHSYHRDNAVYCKRCLP